MNGLRKILIFILIIIAGNIPSYGRDVNFTSIPKDFQLYPRDAQDSCAVVIRGIVQTPGYDSIRVVIYKNEQFWREISQPSILLHSVWSLPSPLGDR